MVDGELAAEVGLTAVPVDEILECPYLVVLESGKLVDEERVGEMVVDGRDEAEVQEGLAEQGVGGTIGLKVVDCLRGLFGLADAVKGLVGDDVGVTCHGDEGGGCLVASAARAGRETRVFEGVEDILEEVGAVGSGVEARVGGVGMPGMGWQEVWEAQRGSGKGRR